MVVKFYFGAARTWGLTKIESILDVDS